MADKTCRCCKVSKALNQFRAGRNECLKCECTKRCNRYKAKKDEDRQKIREEFIKQYNEMDCGIMTITFDEGSLEWVFIFEEKFEEMMNHIKDEWESIEYPKELEQSFRKRLSELNIKAVKYIRNVVPKHNEICFKNWLKIHLIV